MRKSTLTALALLLMVTVMASGCARSATAPPCPGGVVYRNVTHSGVKTYSCDLATVHAAAYTMIDSQGVPLYSDGMCPTGATTEGTLIDGRRLRINMIPKGPRSTEVTIRIGFWGDFDKTNYFFQQLDKQLGL